MKLKTNNKTAISYGKKPYVKKGYYPAKLLRVEPYADKDGHLIEGKYGHQLIFEFAIYSKDENDTPVAPIMFKESGKEDVPAKISKFVYHEYKARNPKPGESQFETAITPKSAITRLLEALGWSFSENDVDIDNFIGKWVEVNLNDFETKTKENEVYTASSINEVGIYNGKEIPSDLEDVKATKKPETVTKQIQSDSTEMKQSPVEDDNAESLKAKIEEMNKLHTDGFLSDDGHKSSIEQLQNKLDSLNN